jgi:hypothetical protein
VIFLLVLLKPGVETPTITVPHVRVIPIVEGADSEGVCELGKQLERVLEKALEARRAYSRRRCVRFLDLSWADIFSFFSAVSVSAT